MQAKNKAPLFLDISTTVADLLRRFRDESGTASSIDGGQSCSKLWTVSVETLKRATKWTVDPTAQTLGRDYINSHLGRAKNDQRRDARDEHNFFETVFTAPITISSTHVARRKKKRL